MISIDMFEWNEMNLGIQVTDIRVIDVKRECKLLPAFGNYTTTTTDSDEYDYNDNNDGVKY